MPQNWSIHFGDFVLQTPLGGSGGGTVYRAYRKSEDRHVAVKMLRFPKNANPDIIQRTLLGLEMVARLRHSHIAEIRGMGQTPAGGHFLVMELIAGADLASRIRYRAMAVMEAAEVVATVAEAVEYAHQNDVIHRDLKPGNVLIDTAGQVKVIDFCPRFGTPQYMAPEQVDQRRGVVGPRTDVYGLGALLYTVLLRRQPFPGSNALEALRHVIRDEMPPPPSRWRRDVPPIVDSICLKCLSKNPADRFATAREVAAALRSCAVSPSSVWDPLLARAAG